MANVRNARTTHPRKRDRRQGALTDFPQTRAALPQIRPTRSARPQSFARFSAIWESGVDMSALLDSLLDPARAAACAKADFAQSLFDALNPLSTQATLARCTIWRNRRAPHLEFPTEAAADAFADGWDAFYCGAPCPSDEHASKGWLMAERREEDACDMRLAERDGDL